MAEAVQLYKQDGSATGVFYCSECRVVFPSEGEAKLCHGDKLCACGAPTRGRFYPSCDECWRKKSDEDEAAKERERFEKAKKITEAEYQGAMVLNGDKYYESVEDAIDGYLEGQEPEYVWACKDVGVPEGSAEGIYENMLENMWEDADVSDLNGVTELEAAICAFNEANKSISVYQPDYSTAILVQVATALGSISGSVQTPSEVTGKGTI